MIVNRNSSTCLYINIHNSYLPHLRNARENYHNTRNKRTSLELFLLFWVGTPSESTDFRFRLWLLSPSKILTSRMFVGNSSMSTSSPTKTRHSGQRSSLLLADISLRHRRQNVCWHGSTLLVWSSLSKHTEHSRISFNCDGSILQTNRALELSARSSFVPHLVHLVSTSQQGQLPSGLPSPSSQIRWKPVEVNYIVSFSVTHLACGFMSVVVWTAHAPRARIN